MQYPPFLKFSPPGCENSFFKVPIDDVLIMAGDDAGRDGEDELVPCLQKLNELVQKNLAEHSKQSDTADSDEGKITFGYSYRDSEGDMVFIKTSKELEIALSDCRGQNSLRIVVVAMTKTTETSHTAMEKETQETPTDDSHLRDANVARRMMDLQEKLDQRVASLQTSIQTLESDKERLYKHLFSLVAVAETLKSDKERLCAMVEQQASDVFSLKLLVQEVQQQQQATAECGNVLTDLSQHQLVQTNPLLCNNTFQGVNQEETQAVHELIQTLEARMEQERKLRDVEVASINMAMEAVNTKTRSLEQIQSNLVAAFEEHEQFAARSLVGRRLSLMSWGNDGSWYPGVITDYNPATSKHTVAYDNGEAAEVFLPSKKLTAAEKIIWLPCGGDNSSHNSLALSMLSSPSQQKQEDSQEQHFWANTLVGRRISLLLLPPKGCGWASGAIAGYHPGSKSHVITLDPQHDNHDRHFVNDNSSEGGGNALLEVDLTTISHEEIRWLPSTLL